MTTTDQEREELNNTLKDIVTRRGKSVRIPELLEAELEELADFILQRDAQREAEITVAGKQIKFTHTAVNGDMHMLVDGYHNPDVCPECIQPGLLVKRLSSPEPDTQRGRTEEEINQDLMRKAHV